MDIEKLIKRLKCPQIQSCPMDGEYPSCKVCQKDLRQEVITEFSTLQAENEKLRKELEWKDMVIELAQRKEREAKAELEQVNLVRCKDCKMSRPGGLGYVWCGPTAMPLDGFRSNGQQKED